MEYERLDTDLRIRVAEYLPFVDRVRLERVNKVFKSNLDRAWAAQKSLAMSYIIYDQADQCPDRCHHFQSTDFYADTGTDYYYLNRNSWKILKRCTNLRALYWNGHPLATNWGQRLARCVPNLEHIYIRDLMTFSGFSSYPQELSRLGKQCQLKCVWIGPDDEEMADNYDDELKLFFRLLPRLRCYSNISCFNTYQVLEEVVSKCQEILVTCFDNQFKCINLIASKAVELSKLQIRAPISRDELEALLRLPLLEDISIIADSRHQKMLTSRHSWSKLHWQIEGNTTPTNFGYDEDTLDDMLRRIGKTLRFLRLSDFNLKSKSLRNLGELCPNLEELALDDEKLLIGNLIAMHLAQLPRIHSLSLKAPNLNNEGLKEILQRCPKLRLLQLGLFKFDDGSRDLLQTYARQHPKRRIIVKLDYKLLTGHEVEDYREVIVRPDLIQIIDNVLYYYVN